MAINKNLLNQSNKEISDQEIFAYSLAKLIDLLFEGRLYQKDKSTLQTLQLKMRFLAM